jgi:hypothetical protein
MPLLNPGNAAAIQVSLTPDPRTLAQQQWKYAQNYADAKAPGYRQRRAQRFSFIERPY